MPRLIDGDNLLGTWPGRRRTAGERRELAREVFRWAAGKRGRTVLVFDGSPPHEKPPHHDVVFSGGGRSADDWIVEHVKRQANPGAWLVVTSDRALGDRCRHAGARVQRCDEFRPTLRQPNKDKPTGPVDIGEWQRYFDGSKDETP